MTNGRRHTRPSLRTLRGMIGLVFAVPASHGRAQTGNLHADLDHLNIRHRTAHYALAGTVSNDRFAESGRCLEYIYEEYAVGFAELIENTAQRQREASDAGRNRRGAGRSSGSGKHALEVVPDSAAFKVVILATDDQYREFGQAYLAGRTEHTRGLFIPSAQLLLIRDEPASHQTYEVLFHEAFHQFAHRYVPYIPVWLDEGLATYYGTARATQTGLVFDRPRSEYFGVIKNARAAGTLIPLEELMADGPLTFYGREPIAGLSHDRTTLSYAQSYTLVAFILQDRSGRDHLREYIRALSKAHNHEDAQQVTRELFDRRLLVDLVPAWLDYVNRR